MTGLRKCEYLLWGLLLLGCQEILKIEIDNLNTLMPIFKIDRDAQIGFPGASIPNFSVVDAQSSKGQTETMMWRIESENGERIHVRQITYGLLPAGFKEVIAPKLLQPNHTYDALIADAGLVGTKRFVLGAK